MDAINGKVILITGGTKGIGLGVAQSLIKEGAKVAVTGRSENSAVEALRILQQLKSGEVMSIVADVRKADDLQRAVAAIISKWGKLDVFVANAGVGHFTSIEELTEEQWNETIDTNLTGVFLSIKSCLAELKKTKGYFITMASLAGTNFFAGASAYNASKFGLVGFTQAVMLDVRKAGIKVTTIMPGSVASNFDNHIPSAEDAWKIQPEDIGQIVIDLLKMNPRTLPSKIEVRPTIPKG